jgi:heme-degrading monooxygenase HmoA
MPVTLLNVFIVPEDKEEEFLLNWRKTTGVFSRKKGFIEAHLHRNTGVGNTAFRFINIAKWESAEAWKQTHDDYRPTEYDIPGVKGHPSIFESIIDAYYEGEG